MTPSLGITQPNLIYYEPVFADELNILLFWALNSTKKEGKSVYFRLSTKKLNQPNRELSNIISQDIINGGYWF